MTKTIRTTAALAAAVLLAAGCAAGAGSGRTGAGGHGSGGASSGGRTRTVAAKGPADTGPATITARQADGLARSLLSRAPLPRGAKVRAGKPPGALGHPSGVEGGGPSVGLHQLWTVREPMSEVYSYWDGHAPAGMESNGSGQSTDRGTVTQEFVAYNLKHLPAGVYTASLGMSVVPGGPDASVIRADVQVIWYPPRTTAEYIPASLHAVTITASELTPSSHSATTTITSPSVVSRLAAMLNGAYATPQGAAFSCPLESLTYRLAFASSAGANPYLVASATSCEGLQITVGGHQQPTLVNPAGLQNLVTSLTHISTPAGGPAKR
ncbi:MAG: hypothetical protein ACRDNF_16585 [Streptosporangiaceae bacterium]